MEHDDAIGEPVRGDGTAAGAAGLCALWQKNMSLPACRGLLAHCRWHLVLLRLNIPTSPPPSFPISCLQVGMPEESLLRAKLMDAILGHDPSRNRTWLPGSQPVSLDASNISLLGERQYWVTWKADGTRYMLVLMRWGTYLVDRKFAIKRVQMRWPTQLQPGQRAKGPTGPQHHWVSLAVLTAGGCFRILACHPPPPPPACRLFWMVRWLLTRFLRRTGRSVASWLTTWSCSMGSHWWTTPGWWVGGWVGPAGACWGLLRAVVGRWQGGRGNV
jgi:hypothetical protein